MTDRIWTKDFFDINSVQEDYDFEAKEAFGRDGQGQVPKSFWESYSAMANTEGGYIVLGLAQKKDAFVPKGVPNREKVIQELWNNLNNPQKASQNLLQNKDIQKNERGGMELIVVHVPQANRKQRPIYVGGNPLTGTYRRNREGDYRCSEEIVKQMLGEQIHDTRDSLILEGFGLKDLHLPTLQLYRQHFSNRQPQHPFNDYDELEFLRQIGSWSQNRQTGAEGLTLAGLLMFGKLRAILDAIPHYIVDYQERPRSISECVMCSDHDKSFAWKRLSYFKELYMVLAAFLPHQKDV